jgi:hypothetical protein
MVKFFNWLSELFSRRSKKPWARFIVSGIDENGMVKFDMAWNHAFIKHSDELGFTGESEEITVQNFLFGIMSLTKDVNDQEILSEQHPHLADERNSLRY